MMGRILPRDERGAAAVEFALVAPVLFGLLLGTVEFGYAFNFQTQVNNYATVTARQHSIDPTKSPTKAAAATALGVPAGNVTKATIVVDGGASGSTCAATANTGKNFTVDVELTRATLTDFFGSTFSYKAKGLGQCP